MFQNIVTNRWGKRDIFQNLIHMVYSVTQRHVFSDGIEDRVVVGSLDLNQCRWLPDEIAGTKPEGIGVDFARAYLSNVCVAKELHRNGVGYKLIDKSKRVG
ncbi:uncharacterized protein LOC110225243 [Arabidopsis lyrata subsp. lyrata]|uniref:uncharacterized protein LOC110225243 n=1 Tax=Arabidopsis lyrata subsp. lyrata TaxID=81972 RepID=UPI000A29A61B|nr:uncharacterized protein LOC110225243 [Arabidopsis lyrata subsp. lyrata]|eukprot:XP_020870136.1 uncharacterized protein LOC110225243 [Arabidopsis lyrata subsp. lyrata]